MNLREQIFLKESIPSLALASEGFEYKHVVSFSDSLPEKRKEALRRASEEYQFIVLDERSPAQPILDLHELARELLEAPSVYGVFRLDDDDILSVNFFKDASKYLEPSFAGMQVSFPRGIEALWNLDEISFLRESYFPMLALGLLGVCEWKRDGSVIAPKPAPHTLSDRYNPVIHDAREIAYVRFNHLTQDTALNSGEVSELGDIARKLLTYPELKEDGDVQDRFPLLKDRFVDSHEYILFEDTTVVSSEIYVPFPAEASSFRLSLDITYEPESQPNSVLVQLDLKDDVGGDIDPQLIISGVATSPDKTIGHYKYLRAAPGRKMLDENIVLPPNIKCRGIALRPWGTSPLPFTLHEASFRVLRS